MPLPPSGEQCPSLTSLLVALNAPPRPTRGSLAHPIPPNPSHPRRVDTSKIKRKVLRYNDKLDDFDLMAG